VCQRQVDWEGAVLKTSECCGLLISVAASYSGRLSFEFRRAVSCNITTHLSMAFLLFSGEC
jgi:hypothetical protein